MYGVEAMVLGLSLPEVFESYETVTSTTIRAVFIGCGIFAVSAIVGVMIAFRIGEVVGVVIPIMVGATVGGNSYCGHDHTINSRL